MRSPYESFPDAPLQELPTPDGPVGPVAGPVERHPNDPLLTWPLVVRQAAGDVRVVVLHAYAQEPRLLQLAGVLGGEVLGVQVVGHQLRLHVEEPAVVLDPLPEGAQGLIVLQVPDVVAEEDVALLGHAEGVLELAPAGQSVPSEALHYPQRRWRVAPRAPDRVRLLPRGPHHAIVAAHVDGPVVNQEEVGYVPKLAEGFLVPVGYRLVGAVAAGHHERDPRIVQQQVVQRGVGQHDAECLLAWRYLLGHPTV